MPETRSSSALFKRAEQLKRWNESETNQVPCDTNKSSRIKFSDGCVFLAACASGDKDEVERLLSLGADINTANVDGLTALHQACIDDNLDMVEFLVEHKCDLNRGDNEGWTPLHATASCGFVSIARYLIEKGANVAAVNNDGDLPIDIGDSSEIEELLQAEIDRLGIDCDAVRLEEERIMLDDAKQWLNARKVEDKVHPKTGATALHVAAAKGYMKVMSLLIQAGADLNMQDNDGWTPLHAAAHWGQKEACEILAENLANMDIQNFAGQTCFDVADPDLIKVLEELKKKQASLSIDKPEIQEILQRKAPPPLKRRTSVTRMSNADKSIVVMKDSFAERAQIEANLRLDEEVEEEEKDKKAGSPVIEVNKAVPATPKDTTLVQNEAIKNERIPEVPVETKEKETPKEETRQPLSVVIPNAKRKDDEEDEDVMRWKTRRQNSNMSETPPISPAIQNIEETVKNIPKKAELIVQQDSVESNNENEIILRRTPSIDENEIKSPTEDNSSQFRRVFIPPTRDDESEAQRKAHAKRVRETRRSTQGVTLEDLKSAEQQLLRKQQEEDERKEREKDAKTKPTDKPKTTEEVVAPSKTPVPSSPTTAQNERRSWRARSDSDSNQDNVVLRRPLSDINQSVTNTPTVVTTNAPGENVSSNSTLTPPPRIRQRPSSAPESIETGSTITVPLRNKKIDDTINQDDDKLDKDKNNEDKSGTQSAIQRRRRPKRRSTGVVHLDPESLGQTAETKKEPAEHITNINSPTESDKTENDDVSVTIFLNFYFYKLLTNFT